MADDEMSDERAAALWPAFREQLAGLSCACGVKGPGRAVECHVAYYGSVAETLAIGPDGLVGVVSCRCACHREVVN